MKLRKLSQYYFMEGLGPTPGHLYSIQLRRTSNKFQPLDKIKTGHLGTEAGSHGRESWRSRARKEDLRSIQVTDGNGLNLGGLRR